MAINGFKADGTTYRYNAEALDGYAPIEDGSVTIEKLANGLVANNLTTATAGEAVLDAAQGKVLSDQISTLSDNVGTLRTSSRTATTTAIGNISLALNASAATVLAAWVTGTYMCIPFTDTNRVWYVKVLNWNGSTFAVADSVSVTVNYLYRQA